MNLLLAIIIATKNFDVASKYFIENRVLMVVVLTLSINKII